MFLFRLIASFCALSLSGCANNSFVPKHWKLTGPKAAVLIVAIGYNPKSRCSAAGHGENSVHIYSNDTFGEIPLATAAGMREDYTDKTGNFALASYSIRPGKYYLADPGYVGGPLNVAPTKKVKLPFELVAGKTYYLGTFSAYSLLGGKNLLGREIPWGFMWLVNSSSPINTAAIKAKFPAIDINGLERLDKNFNMPPYIINDSTLLPKECIGNS